LLLLFLLSLLLSELFLSFPCSNHGIPQQKLAKKDGAPIDRQNDIQVLWNFYLEYKSHRRVDDMQREQERLRESGTFSTEYGLSSVKKIHDVFCFFGFP
jgi:callose synthase